MTTPIITKNNLSKNAPPMGQADNLICLGYNSIVNRQFMPKVSKMYGLAIVNL
jgi:hypothetical protein